MKIHHNCEIRIRMFIMKKYSFDKQNAYNITVNCEHVLVADSLLSKDELLLGKTFKYTKQYIQICYLHFGTMLEIRCIQRPHHKSDQIIEIIN